MRRHPVDGAEILEQITGLREMAQIVRYHQEAYDGSGYPEGLKGEQIPIGARIATVVDAFDAMITNRPYRKGMPIEQAIAELKRNAGKQFDPRIVAAVVEIYEEGTLKPPHMPDPTPSYNPYENPQDVNGYAKARGNHAEPRAGRGSNGAPRPKAARRPGITQPRRDVPPAKSARKSPKSK